MRRVGVIVVVAGLIIASCGSDDDGVSSADLAPTTEPATIEPSTTEPSTTDSPAPTAAAGESTAETTTETATATWPVTIEHSFGETTVDAEPTRIVSLDAQWSDVLTELGAPVVAASDDMYSGSFFPWQELDGVEMLTAQGGAMPFEAIAAAQPDLIVASWQVADEGIYEQLSAIAPTIPLLGQGQVDPWQDMAVAAGETLGMPDEAAALVADSDAQIAALAEELPGLRGKTYALANYVPGDQIYVVADPDDGAAQLFAELGMAIDPDLLAMDGAGMGRVTLSLENIGELDADLLMILPNGADTSEIPGFDALPAVQSGAVAVLDVAEVSGLNTPTPLSVPYSLDFIRPALDAAAAT
jgi:iron complex transport system substrate-binding protein